MRHANNPNQFSVNKNLDHLGHSIELLISGFTEPVSMGFATTQEKRIFWNEIAERGGYLADGKQVLWMCSNNLYSKEYYWVNRDLTMEKIEI